MYNFFLRSIVSQCDFFSRSAQAVGAVPDQISRASFKYMGKLLSHAQWKRIFQSLHLIPIILIFP